MEGSVHWKLYKPFWWGRFWLWDIAACMLPCRIQRTWSFMNYRVAKPWAVHQFFWGVMGWGICLWTPHNGEITPELLATSCKPQGVHLLSLREQKYQLNRPMRPSIPPLQLPGFSMFHPVTGWSSHGNPVPWSREVTMTGWWDDFRWVGSMAKSALQQEDEIYEIETSRPSCSTIMYMMGVTSEGWQSWDAHILNWIYILGCLAFEL